MFVRPTGRYGGERDAQSAFHRPEHPGRCHDAPYGSAHGRPVGRLPRQRRLEEYGRSSWVPRSTRMGPRHFRQLSPTSSVCPWSSSKNCSAQSTMASGGRKPSFVIHKFVSFLSRVRTISSSVRYHELVVNQAIPFVALVHRDEIGSRTHPVGLPSEPSLGD